MLPEYVNYILGIKSHIYKTCILENFESNVALVLCILCIKCGWGILYISPFGRNQLAVDNISIIDHLKGLAYTV